MTETSTLPQALLLETRSISEFPIEEWLDDSELMNELMAEFNDIVIPAPSKAVEFVLAYSAAHEVHASNLLNGAPKVFLN